MRIAKLRMKNWMCFRGEHELVLGPKIYAIIATLGQDAERSNWLGKTTILESIVFALYGDHRFRTDDEWITEGEAVGEVEVELDTGHRIVRSRARGRRTTTYLYPPGDPKGAAIQKEAEEAIEELIGLGRVDFGATAYWEQKAMSRFITSRPEERTRIVGAWFRLEPIKECEKKARASGATLEVDALRILDHLRLIEEREKQILGVGIDWTKETIAGLISELEEALERQRGAVASAEDEMQHNAGLLAAKGRIVDYDLVLDEGKKAKALLGGRKLPVLQESWKKANEVANAVAVEYGAASREEQTKRTVAKGEFDGACPVAGISCPAKDAINADRLASRDAHAAVAKKVGEVGARLATAKAAEQSSRAALQEVERIEQRLEGLREQARRLAPEAKAAKDAGPGIDPLVVRARLEKERTDMMELRSKIDRLKASVADLESIEKTREGLLVRQAEIDAKLVVIREGAAIFKAAQRRVAEGALAMIEADANDALASSGTNLTVEISWSREGKEIATACEQCGHPFPTSAKVKNCERCGTARGLKVENKLEIELSNRSGAAEDLAGAAVQLAASRWLREARGTRWTAALIDEPFGALDAAHRRGFAAHLTAMLSGKYGFEQGFVVAHHSSVLDALPGRIAVLSDGTHSVPKVIA